MIYVLRLPDITSPTSTDSLAGFATAMHLSSLAPLRPFHPFQLLSTYIIVLLLAFPSLAQAQQLANVTVARDAGRIAYEPDLPDSWREAWPGVRISGDSQAKATFDFNGSAVYYQGWYWTQPTSFFAQIDDRPEIVLDLTDPRNGSPAGGSADPNATVTPTTPVTLLVVANLTEGPHRLVLRKGSEQRDVIVGSFIYSTENPPTSGSGSPTPSPSPTNDAPTQNQIWENIRIILPAALGGVFVLSALVCLLFLPRLRRRRQKLERAATDTMIMPRCHQHKVFKRSESENTVSTQPGPMMGARSNNVRLDDSRGGSRVVGGGTRHGAPLEEEFHPYVIPVTPADVGGVDRNWRIE